MERAAVLRMLTALTVALAAGGCGSAAPAGETNTTVDVSSTANRLTVTAPARLRRRHRRAVLHGPAVGATQRTVSQGSHLTVTVQRLVDPLTDASASLLPGTRAVGVLVELTNAGPALYDSSATGDFSVVASRGQVTPLFVPGGVCQTPDQDFDRYMTAGESRSGCVAFSVSSRARVLGVRFTPHARAAGSLTWTP